MILSDFHTHTLYCDGHATPEEMVQSAIRKGLSSFGISGHAPMFGQDWCMTSENAEKYLTEITALKQKYSGVIELYTGLEVDCFCPPVTLPFDYKIGSMHFVATPNGRFLVDLSRELLKTKVNEEFGGDYYACCTSYYEALTDIVSRTDADIIGHFDIITKYNEGNILFDESNPRYVKAALGAVSELVKTEKPFEINTGAISRKARSVPYPAVFILKEIKRLGGRIIFNSDAHIPENIGFWFNEAVALAKACGFTSAVTICGGKFIEIGMD